GHRVGIRGSMLLELGRECLDDLRHGFNGGARHRTGRMVDSYTLRCIEHGLWCSTGGWDSRERGSQLGGELTQLGLSVLRGDLGQIEHWNVAGLDPEQSLVDLDGVSEVLRKLDAKRRPAGHRLGTGPSGFVHRFLPGRGGAAPAYEKTRQIRF